ncbi:MAG TPA: polysaccharide pyruvyl transferase family protein [Propionibacteriaceae bacterium]|jgi:polysaccharide pyruvyl transferase WcaK-like protein
MTQTHTAQPPQGAPRVLIEHSEYWLSNIGDLAMMDVTIRRLRERWPNGRVGVLTDTPLLLHAYFPGVDAVDTRGSSAWKEAGVLAKVARHVGPRLVGPLAIGSVTARAWLPQKARGLKRRSRRLLRLALRGSEGTGPAAHAGLPPEVQAPVNNRPSPNTLLAADSSSLVLALGGGYLTDQDLSQATRVLNLLEHAHETGTRTAMIGQGLGPIDDPALATRASQVLPLVDFVALRERRKGPELLEGLGVSPERVTVTGDDAIELAYALRRPDLGSDIGVCLRVAGYSPVSGAAKSAVGSALQTMAGELQAGLVPVMIAEYRSQDRRSTLPLLRGYPQRRRPLGRFARPQDVAAQVGGCRVMVTGAYHAAVFALSQGIPVLAVTSSSYYDDKFLGLAGMFGTGLELVSLGSEDLEERLLSGVRGAWDRAHDVRPALLARAAEQIAASRQAFNRACGMVQ